MRRPIVLALMAVLLPLTALGQTPSIVKTSPFLGPGQYAGGNIVRASDGALFVVSLDDAPHGAVDLHVSHDGGRLWQPLVESGQGGDTINDTSHGIAQNWDSTDSVAVAIDDQDRLHIVWGRMAQPPYHHFYRSYDYPTRTLGPIKNFYNTPNNNWVTPMALDIAVGPDGTVWATAPSTVPFQARLMKSAQPYAANNQWGSVGDIDNTLAYAVRMEVDALGRVQMSFAGPPGNPTTGSRTARTYDPATNSWSLPVTLGGQRTQWGDIRCDALGNTHYLIVKADVGFGPATVSYARQNPNGTFSSIYPIMVDSTPSFGCYSDPALAALTCNEATGECTVMFRDPGDGNCLQVSTNSLTSTPFSELMEMQPSIGDCAFYSSPHPVGSMWPVTNRCGSDPCFVWKEGGANWTTSALKVASVYGSDPGPSHVRFSKAFLPAGQVDVTFKAPGHENELYLPVISSTYGRTPLGGTPYDLPVVSDALTDFYFLNPAGLQVFQLAPGGFVGLLDGYAEADGQILLPFVPAGFSLDVVVSFLTIDGNGISGVSHATEVTLP